MLTGRSLAAGNRRRSCFRGSRDDLARDIELQLDGEPIGSGTATLWSPEPRRRWHPAVVHSGYYANASFWRLSDEIKQPEDVQSHPESDDVIGEANHGRRWAQLHGFRWTSTKGIGQICLILITLAWFLQYEKYWKNDGAPELLLRAPYSLHRRCTSSPELGFLGFAEKQNKREEERWELGFLRRRSSFYRVSGAVARILASATRRSSTASCFLQMEEDDGFPPGGSRLSVGYRNGIQARPRVGWLAGPAKWAAGR
jgi:hypothetical protein